MIESRNLFILQNKLTKNSKTIPIKTIEKDYILSWILIGIAKSKIHEILSFKGGTALKKFYFPNYRFSEDLDFTLEKLINQPIIKTLLREYDEYKDIPEGIRLKIYPLDEIFLEKYLTILDTSRNEPRDVYDLWYLVSNKCLEFEDLGEDIKEKCVYKGLTSLDIMDALARKESNYERLWMARLDKHMIDLPYFDKVYRELKRYLRPLNRTLE